MSQLNGIIHNTSNPYHYTIIAPESMVLVHHGQRIQKIDNSLKEDRIDMDQNSTGSSSSFFKDMHTKHILLLVEAPMKRVQMMCPWRDQERCCDRHHSARR